jgi:hypothetical protein
MRLRRDQVQLRWPKPSAQLSIMAVPGDMMTLQVFVNASCIFYFSVRAH